MTDSYGETATASIGISVDADRFNPAGVESLRQLLELGYVVLAES